MTEEQAIERMDALAEQLRDDPEAWRTEAKDLIVTFLQGWGFLRLADKYVEVPEVP